MGCLIRLLVCRTLGLFRRMSDFIAARQAACLYNSRGISANCMLPSFFCNPPTPLYYVTFIEEPVDFFERQIGSLGIAEIL
jgi:hypothetical protein